MSFSMIQSMENSADQEKVMKNDKYVLNKLQQDKETYMVAMPFYEGKQAEMPERMEKQGYFSEDDNLYLFCVTEEQFDELTQDYFKACDQSEEESEKLASTYGELFGT